MSRRQYMRQMARRSLDAAAKEATALPPAAQRPLDAFLSGLPPWAESATSQLRRALRPATAVLTEEEKWGAVIAASLAAGNAQLNQSVLRDCEGRIPHQTRDLARLAAIATMLSSVPARQVETGKTPPEPDQRLSAMFSLAAGLAWTAQTDPQRLVDAAYEQGLEEASTLAVRAIAEGIAVIARVQSGISPQDTPPSKARLHVS